MPGKRNRGPYGKKNLQPDMDQEDKTLIFDRPDLSFENVDDTFITQKKKRLSKKRSIETVPVAEIQEEIQSSSRRDEKVNETSCIHVQEDRDQSTCNHDETGHMNYMHSENRDMTDESDNDEIGNIHMHLEDSNNMTDQSDNDEINHIDTETVTDPYNAFDLNWWTESDICESFECPGYDLTTVFENLSEDEFQDNDENEECVADKDEVPLYDSAKVTVGAIMLLLALFVTKHAISSEGIQQLLNLFAVALPNGNHLCTTLSSFKSFFKNLKNPIIKHYYCNSCLGLITEETAQKCPYASCGKSLQNVKEYFLEMPIDEQLKTLFAQEGFFNNLQERFNHRSENKISDIYDGHLYQKYFVDGGPLSSQGNISFTLNTDGAPVFKSSNVSVWPIFLMVNELPYVLRMKKENMLLAGLWFGSKKPYMGTFLQPFLEKFKNLELGLDVFSPDCGYSFKVKAFLLCCTADLPARCLLCNSIQFNGYSSCWKCLQTGESAKSGKGRSHVFPFKEDGPKDPVRTQESVHIDAKKALDQQERENKKSVVNGVKGPSWLMFFPRFNIIDGVAIDYMHGVLLGVQKLLLNLWFGTSHKGKTYCLFDKVCEVDHRLLSLKPTLNIKRLPRSIQNDLKYWKASEFRSFLLYYGAPILKGILDRDRFCHYLLFVNAIHVLLKDGISEKELSSAEMMLFDFVKQFSHLYDLCFMTLNIHQLLHLVDNVRSLGPLFTHSCFGFEDKNGVLLKFIRGTQNIDNQIITGVSFLQKLPELKCKTIPKGSELERLYNSIEHPSVLARKTKIKDDVYILGGINSRTLSDNEHDMLCTYLGYAFPVQTSVKCFKRLEIGKNLIYSMSYSRMIKRDNSTICFKQVAGNEQFGRVLEFLVIDLNDQLEENVFVLVKELQRVHISANDDTFLIAVEETENVCVIPLNAIVNGCMFISYLSHSNLINTFICKFPNNLETD